MMKEYDLGKILVKYKTDENYPYQENTIMEVTDLNIAI